MRNTRSACEWTCNKIERCQSNDSNTRIDTVFGELLKCKWDANAACTWDNQEGRADCVNNCVCLLGGGITTDICLYPLMYGQPYHLQLVSSSVRKWLTNSRRSKGKDRQPRTGTGSSVWTEDCAHKGGSNACTSNQRTIEPEQYRWIISSGSEPSDGSTFDENGEVIFEYKITGCIKYGDEIYIQGASKDNHWLTGGHGSKHKAGVYMKKTASSRYEKWIVRSTPISDRFELDPRHRQCVRSMDRVYFQNRSINDRYLSAGRNKGAWNTYTVPIWEEPSQFEMRSDTDTIGRLTTKAADPPTLPREN